MATPRFLIAKYVRNMARMEPRNIGVLVWDNGRVASRFIGDAAPDGQASAAPAFMSRKNQGVYRRWVAYWRELLDGNTIRAKDGQEIVRADERFLDAMLAQSRDNYLITPGGRIPVKSRTVNLGKIADELFAEFVEESGRDAVTELQSIQAGWSKAVKKSGISTDALAHNVTLQCKIGDVSKHFQFDYTLGNGQPTAVFQKALLMRPESTNSASLKLMLLFQNQVLPKEQCAAIIHYSDEQLSDPMVAENVSMLGSFARLINVAHEEQAAQSLAEMANYSTGA